MPALTPVRIPTETAGTRKLHLISTTNTTAMHNNGQSIWFYEWNHIKSLDSHNTAFQFNMACEDGDCAKYEVQAPVQ